MTDGHRRRGLPQIPLADLARPIDRPLMRAQPQEHRADLAQVVINDRLAAIEPQRLDLLPHPHARELRVVLQQPVDLVLGRIQLRRPLRHPELSRLLGPQRRPDRVSRQPRPADQLLDRHTANQMLPAKLSPLLHVQHAFLPASINNTEPRLTITPDASAHIHGWGQISGHENVVRRPLSGRGLMVDGPGQGLSGRT